MIFWVKENGRTIVFMQSYRMGNSFPNLVHVDDVLLASVMSIYCRRRKEVLVLKVQKNVLGRVSLVIIIEIHQEKNKRGIRNVAWTC